jgi:hypothetical protein
MAVEANLNKTLYKTELYLIKVIPMIFAGLSLLNDVLSYFYIDVPLLSYIASVSVLTLIFMYLSSVVFKFCAYHRMFIHYTAVNWVLNIIDYYIGIPLDSRELFIMYMSIAGIALFLILLKIRK